MRKYFNLLSLITSFFVFSVVCYGQESLETKKITLDSITQQEAWQNINSHDFNPAAPGIFQVTGNFDDQDLAVSLKMAWNENALYFNITWSDDVFDGKFIPRDSSTYLDENGRRRDRMYLFDNLKIQLRFDGINYVSWFKQDEHALQWHSLRKRIGRQSTSMDVSPPSFAYAQLNSSTTNLKVELRWEDLLPDSDLPNEMDLLLLVNDRDDLQAKLSERKTAPFSYISLQKQLILN